jgi:hypothetical protein
MRDPYRQEILLLPQEKDCLMPFRWYIVAHRRWPPERRAGLMLGIESDMHSQHNTRISSHRGFSVALLGVYLFITATAESFHSEGCPHHASQSQHKDAIHSGASCSACAFAAGSNATGVDHSCSVTPKAIHFRRVFVSLDLQIPRFWASSISLRAPPASLPS